MRLVEFRPDKQGRPAIKQSVDMGTGLPTFTVPLLKQTDVDNEPVEGAIRVPISSSWAWEFSSEQEEQNFFSNLILKKLLFLLGMPVDFESPVIQEVDPDEVDIDIDVTGLSGLLADDQHVLDSEVLAVAAPISTYYYHGIDGGNLGITYASLVDETTPSLDGGEL